MVAGSEAEKKAKKIQPNYPQRIGLRENLSEIILNLDWLKGTFTEKNIVDGKIYGFRFRFSLKPIHWHPEKNRKNVEELKIIVMLQQHRRDATDVCAFSGERLSEGLF